MEINCPRVIWRKIIITYLSHEELCRLSRVSKYFHEIITNYPRFKYLSIIYNFPRDLDKSTIQFMKNYNQQNNNKDKIERQFYYNIKYFTGPITFAFDTFNLGNIHHCPRFYAYFYKRHILKKNYGYKHPGVVEFVELLNEYIDICEFLKYIKSKDLFGILVNSDKLCVSKFEIIYHKFANHKIKYIDEHFVVTHFDWFFKDMECLEKWKIIFKYVKLLCYNIIDLLFWVKPDLMIKIMPFIILKHPGVTLRIPKKILHIIKSAELLESLLNLLVIKGYRGMRERFASKGFPIELINRLK